MTRRVFLVESWRHAGRVARGVAWVILALAWTGCEAVELGRELRNHPGAEYERRRRAAAVSLLTPAPPPAPAPADE